jgi:hypothetical protein
MIRPVLAVAAAATLAAACSPMYTAYSQPYVKFEAEHSQNLKGLFAATVVAVDGQRINAGDTPPFPPGMRTVDVEMRLQHDAYSPERKSIRVDAKPCMRYYLASRKTPEGPFVPVVSHEEPIKECQGGTM